MSPPESFFFPLYLYLSSGTSREFRAKREAWQDKEERRKRGTSLWVALAV
jgi:hypothetical protein